MSILLVGLLGLVVARADEAPSRPPHLLLIAPDPDGPYGKDLAECDRLTIEAYRQHGVQVTTESPANFKSWLEGPGTPYAKAHYALQCVAWAQVFKADAVGWLDYYEITPEDEKEYGTPAGVYYQRFGVSLSGFTHAFMVVLHKKAAVEALPLRFEVTPDDIWSLPRDVRPRKVESQPAYPQESRPYLGVGLNDDLTVAKVLPETPAASAGLMEGDKLVAVAGKTLEDGAALRRVIGELPPGQQVTLVYEHNGERVEKQVTLADYVVEAKKRSPIGKPIPALVGKDIDGQEVRLADLKGRVVLLDYWATWCGPCIEEMPLLHLLAERLKDADFTLVGVSVDENAKAWEKFVRDNRLPGIQLRAMEWADRMSVDGYPTILVIDREGIVRADVRGEEIAQAVLGWMGSVKPPATSGSAAAAQDR